MKIKTGELEGAALDWAVAKVEGREIVIHGEGQYRYDKPGGIHCCKYGCTFGPRSIQRDVGDYSPSADWSQGGPLIGRLEMLTRGHGAWYAIPICDEVIELSGETPLVAAMRAIVASEIGDEVDVPEELL